MDQPQISLDIVNNTFIAFDWIYGDFVVPDLDLGTSRAEAGEILGKEKQANSVNLVNFVWGNKNQIKEQSSVSRLGWDNEGIIITMRTQTQPQ